VNVRVRASCHGKRRYGSYSVARAVLKAARKRKNRGVCPPVGMYRCGVCGCYHLTSQTKKERRAS
jgi:hypothetical protein